jgi:hypothetical protein
MEEVIAMKAFSPPDPLPRRSLSARRSRSLLKRRTLALEPLEPRIVLANQPVITEFMASNSSDFRDGDGNASDWIEIYNPTAQAMNLAGWHLTDDATNLDKWTFPAAPQAVLDPGEFLVVFASGQATENHIDSLGYMHTDFALSAGGEYLALTNPSELVISEFAPTYPPQLANISYGYVRNTQTIELIGPATAASALVPTNGALDASAADVPPAWTLPGFNDAAWPTAAGVGVGFDTGDDAPNNVPNGTILPGGPLGNDLTDPEDDGTLTGTFTAGGPSPGGEEPPNALDGNAGTKWLSFIPEGTFYQFHFNGGERETVNGYTITSANDASERDPYTWTLSGSNDGVNWTPVDARTAQDFTSRFQTRLYEFSNNIAYEYYRFDFLTEYGATGQNQPNSIQMAEIELFSSGSINYNDLIDVNLAAAWNATKSSVYHRVEFNVDDPAQLASLLMELQYDDGFVAYLNGHRVASAFAPTLPNYQTSASGEREDSDSIDPEKFDLSQYLSYLTAGVNVLAIHALNVSDASPDLLSLPRLTATRVIDANEVVAYMPKASPGGPNVFTGVTVGPLISEVTENPTRPTEAQNLPITARVTAQGSPVTGVMLHYRVMYNPETTLTMLDNGVGADLVAGDGLYTAVIPASASGPDQMVRWYVTATDAAADQTRYPLFLDPNNSPEYLGTVVQANGVSTALPVFEYFVQNVAASGTEAGTRSSVYFRGEFYDNVFVRRRGGNTTQGRKFEFNDGYHFLFDPDYGRVDEINLNQRGSESTYMRQVLAWQMYGDADAPASIGEAWYTRLNSSYLDVRIFVEQPDADLLVRTGLDPNGAFYKMGADGIENSVTSSTNGVTKRTRKTEDNSDLQALVNGVSPNNPNRSRYVFDNIDIAAAINYLAATSIMHDNDSPHKNYHLYRDTEGSQQWTFIPWDKDLTFGLNFGINGIIGNVDPFSHPFFGDQDHQKIDNQWNRMIDAVFSAPTVKEMYVRRLRTLMDQFLGAPGTPAGTSWLETHVAALKADLQPLVGGSSWLTEVNKIVGEYLTERRQHLYVDHSITNPGYPDNAAIPAAQVGNPLIQFGVIDANPASGNQDQEYIQLTNPNATAVDVSNWRLAGGIDYTLRAGTVIPAGGTLYVAADVPSFLVRTTGPRGGQFLFVQGNYGGRLSNFGGTLQLIAADGTLVSQTTTPGNPLPYQGQIVFSEIHYHPANPPAGSTITDLQLEFIEVHNRTSAPVPLTGWQIREGVTYDFTNGASLPAHGTLVIVPFDPANASLAQEFRSIHGVGSAVTLIGPYAGQLSNGGEAVSLLAPGAQVGTTTEVDRVDYLDTPSWPTGADGEGQSLTRTLPNAPGESPSSWIGASPTPGSASFAVLAPGDFDSDSDVDGADFLTWQRNLGRAAGATQSQGDADGDGDVDAIDLSNWRIYFGPSFSNLAAAAPAIEPLRESSSSGAALTDAALIDVALSVALNAPFKWSTAAPPLRHLTPINSQGIEWRPSRREPYDARPLDIRKHPNDDSAIDAWSPNDIVVDAFLFNDGVHEDEFDLAFDQLH